MKGFRMETEFALAFLNGDVVTILNEIIAYDIPIEKYGSVLLLRLLDIMGVNKCLEEGVWKIDIEQWKKCGRLSMYVYSDMQELINNLGGEKKIIETIVSISNYINNNPTILNKKTTVQEK